MTLDEFVAAENFSMDKDTSEVIHPTLGYMYMRGVSLARWRLLANTETDGAHTLEEVAEMIRYYAAQHPIHMCEAPLRSISWQTFLSKRRGEPHSSAPSTPPTQPDPYAPYSVEWCKCSHCGYISMQQIYIGRSAPPCPVCKH